MAFIFFSDFRSLRKVLNAIMQDEDFTSRIVLRNDWLNGIMYVSVPRNGNQDG